MPCHCLRIWLQSGQFWQGARARKFLILTFNIISAFQLCRKPVGGSWKSVLWSEFQLQDRLEVFCLPQYVTVSSKSTCAGGEVSKKSLSNKFIWGSSLKWLCLVEEDHFTSLDDGHHGRWRHVETWTLTFSCVREHQSRWCWFPPTPPSPEMDRSHCSLSWVD